MKYMIQISVNSEDRAVFSVLEYDQEKDAYKAICDCWLRLNADRIKQAMEATWPTQTNT